jgi:imidazolonepropionase-like amidohydrolase
MNATAMRVSRLTIAAAGLVLLSGVVTAQSLPEVAIRGVAVIDVRDGSLTHDQTVITEGDRIREIGPTRSVLIPQNATIFEGKGLFVMPGLWDMHVHTTDPSYFTALVANGVVGIRDMGGGALSITDGCESLRLDSLVVWRQRIERDSMIGPRIVLAGAPASGTGWPTSLPARTPEEAREAVNTLRKLGADFVKVYEKIPADAYHALGEAAREAALPMAGHVPESVSLLDAIHAGQRSVEHIRAALLVCFARDSAELARFFKEDNWDSDDIIWGIRAHADCPSVLEALRTRDVWLTPTLVVERSKIAVEEPSFLADPARARLPIPIRDALAAYARAKLAQSRTDRASEHLWWRTQQLLVGRASTAGASFLAGTDAACEGGIPGSSLHEELALLVSSGLSPLQALQAATLNPARYLGVEDRAGAVLPSYSADLVVLRGNPLEDIRHTRAIAAVVLRGRLLVSD